MPRRLDGIVTEKSGLVTIEYKEKGMVKTKTSTYPAGDVTYMTGSPGFVIDMSSAPITQFVGEMKMKDGRMTVVTEAGTVVVNKLPGLALEISQVDAESREARVAERVGKVRVKLPRAAKATAEKTSKKAKASKGKAEEAPAKKKKTDKSASRTEATLVKKKKKSRSE